MQVPLKLVPMCLIEVAAVHLRDVGKHVVLGIVEDDRGVHRLRTLVGVVEHVGRVDEHAFFGGPCLDEVDPILPPRRGRGALQLET